jgi:hypothetical protein
MSQPNWSTFQLLPSWLSSWCYQQMIDWKVIARYKLSSLFGHVIGNEEKKFYNIETRSPFRFNLFQQSKLTNLGEEEIARFKLYVV